MNGFSKGAAIGGIAGALVAGSTIALAGTGVGGIFNLGVQNTVDAQSTLKGSVSGAAQLRVENGSSGFGVFGLSTSGKGVYGKHSATTGGEPGVQGETASAAGAGVVGRNTGGGPGLSAFVNPGNPPLSVNSSTRVANLNADLVDGKNSTAFLSSTGDIVAWYSPYDYWPAPRMHVVRSFGPAVALYSDGTVDQVIGAVVLPLDQPQSIFGAGLKFKALTICFKAQGAQIIGTRVHYGQAADPGQQTVVHEDTFVHSSPGPTCYDVTPSTPTVIAGSLYLALDVQFYTSEATALWLYSVRARLGT
jgi:hypothetical protein